MNTIKGKKLKKGDLIAVVSPSSSIKNFPRRIKRGVKFLESKGYRVKLMPNTLKTQGYNAGSNQERAEDINSAFADPEVKMILTSTGGLTANGILPYLDLELIKKNPKIFCGYSDISTLNYFITSQIGLVTFHGPTLLPSFGEFEGSVDFTFDFFEKVLSGEWEFEKPLPKSEKYSLESLFWDKEDDRELKMIDSPEIYSLGPKGEFQGKLFGGNLQTLTEMINDENFFDLKDTVLFLEEEGLSIDWYERYFNFLKNAGVFEKVKALIIAKPTKEFLEKESEERNLKKVLTEISDEFNLPILANIDCGHTKPLLTFPLGIEVKVDTEKREIYFLENGVE